MAWGDGFKRYQYLAMRSVGCGAIGGDAKGYGSAIIKVLLIVDNLPGMQ